MFYRSNNPFCVFAKLDQAFCIMFEIIYSFEVWCDEGRGFRVLTIDTQ